MGSIIKLDRPPPDDEEVRRIIEDALLEKYG